jgi:hypothetical protein
MKKISFAALVLVASLGLLLSPLMPAAHSAADVSAALDLDTYSFTVAPGILQVSGTDDVCLKNCNNDTPPSFPKK